jgi:dihydrofolate reductase
MKVFIIAAITADGFIGRDAKQLANWTSREDKRIFVELTKRAGVIIMGGNTYKTIGRALPGRRNIVYSHETINQEGIETTQEKPDDLIKRLEREGHTEVAICGGRQIYTMFLDAGLVDELYLTVEPVLFGQGVSLSSSSLAASLNLKELKQLNDNVLLLHYEVTT